MITQPGRYISVRLATSPLYFPLIHFLEYNPLVPGKGHAVFYIAALYGQGYALGKGQALAFAVVMAAFVAGALLEDDVPVLTFAHGFSPV